MFLDGNITKGNVHPKKHAEYVASCIDKKKSRYNSKKKNAFAIIRGSQVGKEKNGRYEFNGFQKMARIPVFSGLPCGFCLLHGVADFCGHHAV